MNDFIPYRLRIARQIAGYSLGELSEKIGCKVTKQALSKYELAMMKPSETIVNSLSEALGVPANYFTGNGLCVDLPSLRTSTQLALTDADLQVMESIILFYAERFRNKALSLNLSLEFECPLLGKEISNIEDVKVAADSLRMVWSCGNGAIPSVIRLLERQGIWVFDSKLPDNIWGLSTWVDDRYPLIILDTRKEKTTVERLRFTAAHELGHLLFSFAPDLDTEKMCNRFASFFLFPSKTFIQEICGTSRDELYLEELIDLHEAYGVSIAALIHEAYDLGVISRNYYNYWYDSIIKKNPKEEGWGEYKFPETLGKEKRMNIRVAQQK